MMGETSRGDDNVIEDVSLLRSKELTLVVPHLEEPPFVEFDGDLVLNSDTPSIEHINPIALNYLTQHPFHPLYLLPPPSYMYTCRESLGDIRGYSPSFDPCCGYLGDVPRKIMWSTFFDHTFDFSMAFSKFKRPLTFLPSSFIVPSYLHHFEMHVVTYDKLL